MSKTLPVVTHLQQESGLFCPIRLIPPDGLGLIGGVSSSFSEN